MRRLSALGLLLALLAPAAPEQCTPPRVEGRHGVLFVDGRAIVPAGVYFWPDVSKPSGRNPFEDVARYGLDTLVAYYEYVRPDRTVTNQPDIHEMRAECERLRLHCFVGAPGPADLAGRSDAELEALFAATTDAFAGSPAVLGWLFDEPIWNGIDLELMTRVVAAIRRHPARPVIHFLYAPVDVLWDSPGWPDMVAYSALADVVGFDFYPVETGMPWVGYISKSRLEDFGWYVDRVREWVGPHKPVWATQQGYRTGDLDWPPTARGRRPDARETRFMTFQALAHGASGLLYFTGSRLGHAIPFDDPTWDQHIRAAAADLRLLRPFLAAWSRPRVSSSAGSVRVFARRHRDRRLVIAVREQDGPPVEARIAIAGRPRARFRVLGEERSLELHGGAFTDRFEGYGVHVYVERRR